MTDECIQLDAKVVSVLPGTMFKLELPNKHQILGHISGKLRKNFININIGDTVKIEMSPYDLSKARIVYRMKAQIAPRRPGAPVRSFGPRNKRPGPRK